MVPSCARLRDLALDAGSISAAIECVDQEIAATGATERRADLLVEKAVLYADHLLIPHPLARPSRMPFGWSRAIGAR